MGVAVGQQSNNSTMYGRHRYLGGLSVACTKETTPVVLFGMSYGRICVFLGF